MKIEIIAVGKIKEKFVKSGIAEYQKRLQSYCKIKITEVPDEKAPEGATEKEKDKIKAKEGQGLLKKIPGGAVVIALALEGKDLTSESLSKTLEQYGLEGKSHVAFIIGGSLGLSKEVLRRADLQLSFSAMTFPHQLMRLILVEQIYRSFKIMKNEPYHK